MDKDTTVLEWIKLVIWRRSFIPIIIHGEQHRKFRKRKQWRSWECFLMALIDFRYWNCECHYWPPYGRVISADCEKHD